MAFDIALTMGRFYLKCIVLRLVHVVSRASLAQGNSGVNLSDYTHALKKIALKRIARITQLCVNSAMGGISTALAGGRGRS